MPVRVVTRRDERRLVVDIHYRDPNGTYVRYRHDAEVQTLQAARAEDRRRLGLIATTGSPDGILPVGGAAGAIPPEPKSGERVSTAPLFKEVAKEYLAAFATSNLKPSTRRSYKAALDSFLLSELGDEPIDEITAPLVRQLDAQLVGTGVAPSTRRNHQIVLRSILCRYAVEQGYFTEPPRFPSLPKVGEKVATALTVEEVHNLLAACANPEQRRALMLAAYTGLRAGEIRALRWKDVDLRTGTLTVRLSKCRGELSTPKSGNERLIPLVPELRAELARSKVREKEDYVTRSSKGEPWGEFSLRKAFLGARARAGLSDEWRLHDLRHFFVTTLFRSGAPAPVVQRLAGHSDLKTTQRYAHASRVDLHDAVARLAVTVR